MLASGARRQLEQAAHALERLRREREVGAADELIAATGVRPDLSLLAELRLDLDDRVEAARALAPLIDPNLHSCGSVAPHGVDQLSHPDAGVYVVGMKGYGRAPTFLLRTGGWRDALVILAVVLAAPRAPPPYGAGMIDHLKLLVSDAGRSRRFYEQALEPLGYRVMLEPAPGVVGMGVKFPDFWIAPSGGEPATNAHVALRVDSRALVDAFHAAGVAAGGSDNGGPGLRPHYHPDYYGAFVFDPDGNNVEAVCHTA